MVLIRTLSLVAFYGFFLHSTSVEAVPFKQNHALVKRGSQLHGKFLHITDIHIDPLYKEGADPKKLCHTFGKQKDEQTGKFGALGTKCDSPIPLVDATFSFLKNDITDIDFIIYTGDTVRHDRDGDLPRTKEEVIEGHKTVMKYFRDAYNVKYVPYVPTIGNNDAFVHNDLIKNDKIFDQLESIWEPLGLNLTSDFSSGGYFVQDVIPDQLSIINLNSMYFFKKNDQASNCEKSKSSGAMQLNWLENTLKYYANKKSHRVYIMGHIPPLNDKGSMLFKKSCFSSYHKLLSKYGDIIVGHFTGHTNNDNLNAIISNKDDSDIIVAGGSDIDANSAKNVMVGLFNAPSIIPDNNPALRVYTYETKGAEYPVGTIRDWDQYYVDLKKANSDGNVKYQLEYKASKLYNVDHFDGEGVGQAMLHLVNDKESRDLYNKYRTVLA
ncbi:Metallo-dependent phosphatase-like protein [Blakeslea trispora]|nr:Metallo-dependent phosphatase-like protein [Blakeslea trispora]